MGLYLPHFFILGISPFISSALLLFLLFFPGKNILFQARLLLGISLLELCTWILYGYFGGDFSSIFSGFFIGQNVILHTSLAIIASSLFLRENKK
jgi:hypothetical protein